ncbi:MAG: histidinol dehydrogenase [Pseudomonadota bacterium]
MKIPAYRWRDLDSAARAEVLARPAVAASDAITNTVRDIVAAVRADGDDAVRHFSKTLDGVALDSLKVDAAAFDAADRALSDEDRAAIRQAIANIRVFHEAQRPGPISVETMPGVRCERLSQPVDAVGLYVPAGSAPLPSAAMMLAVPAAIAGCPVRVLCSPPAVDGEVHPAILFAAREAGVTDVFRIGGAQAIAAMAYGTDSVPKVHKVFGPGNAFVTEAKSQVSADPAGAAQDMPAGPSEVLVIADAAANPDYVAADLLSQAEHGPDSQVVLLTDSATLIARVQDAVIRLTAELDRAEIVADALANSALIEVTDIDEAVAISNDYAPEHLIVNTADARDRLADIRNAGSVFLGRLTPESLGDYCSGTNHVLPTYGYARNYSGLGVDQFLRYMTVQEVTADGLTRVGPVAARLASLEGLDAHRLAVDLRLAGDGA